MAHPDSSATHSPSSSSIHSQNSNGPDREEMLRQLANKTLAQFDIGSPSPSEPGDDPADEWEGIQSDGSDASEQESCYSIADSGEDFDDPEDLHQSLEHHPCAEASEREPELIVFQDPSRPLKDKASLNPSNQSERKSFMASMLKKQIDNQIGGPSTANRKRNSSSKEDEDEAKLEHLDRSLSNLISHLSGPNKKTRSIGLETILSSTLPPLTKDKNPQRHPRKIKAGMARAELQRSLAADKEALMNGTVRSSNAKTLTKKQKRIQDGTDQRDRRERRNRTDRPLGTSKGPGGMIKLSSRDIKAGMNQSNSHSKKRKR